MNAKDRKRNVTLYRLYAIFNEPLFWGPILIISLQKLAGMSLPDIYYMEAVVIVICVVLDIPSGALADIIGKKKTIIVGRMFLFGSISFFATMTGPADAWTGNILWAIGFTLQSGADTSLLYETLAEGGEEYEYKRTQGQANGFRLILVACCSLSVGFLAEIDPRLPLYLCVPFVLIPLVSSFFLKEPVLKKSYSVMEQLETMIEGCKFVLKSKEVRWMVGFAALLGTTSKLWFFTYNPYFEEVGIDIKSYGVIFFFLNVVAWLSSHFAHSIERRLGERNCVISMVACLSAPILVMGLVPTQISAYLVVVQNIVRGFMKPFSEDYVHRHISRAEQANGIRATVMSAQSSVSNFASIIGLAGFGLLVERLSLFDSLTLLGTLALALGTLSYRSYRKKIA